MNQRHLCKLVSAKLLVGKHPIQGLREMEVLADRLNDKGFNINKAFVLNRFTNALPKEYKLTIHLLLRETKLTREEIVRGGDFFGDVWTA